MSGLGFVRLPKRSLRNLRTFLDGFYRERSPNLFNHPHVINECRGRKLSKETQLFNELVLWLRYYEALVARRPTHIDLMDRIRTEYDRLFGFVRADGELSPYFGLSDVDVVGGMVYADDYIPRVDVFIQGLYDLAAYLSAKDGSKIADGFGFINLRSDEAQRLVSNARSAADNLHTYRLLDVRDFQNSDPLVVALNRLMYLCRVAYAMSKGWREICEAALDRLNLIRRRLILSFHESPAFARVYARNALERVVDHTNVYALLRRFEEDRVLFKNALRWGDPDWGLDSTSEEEDDDEGDGDRDGDARGIAGGSLPLRRGGRDVGDGGPGAGGRTRVLSDPGLGRGDDRGKETPGRSASRGRGGSVREDDGGRSSWRSATDGELSDGERSWSGDGDGFDSLLDVPRSLRAEPDAAGDGDRKAGAKRRASVGAASAADRPRARTYWLESGGDPSSGGAPGPERVFVSDGKTVTLPVALDAASPSPASSTRPPPERPGTEIGTDDVVFPPISYLDERYFRPSGPRVDGPGGREERDLSPLRPRSLTGKAVRPRKAAAQRNSGASYAKRRPTVRSDDEDEYYWDDLGEADDGVAEDDDFERIQRQLQGLNINSPTAGGPQFAPPLSRGMPSPPSFLPAGDAVGGPDASDSSGVTVLSNDTGDRRRHKSGSGGR
ncbi:pR32 [rat cytomegalovirus strain Maastricht]|uniref:PR32 n=1 Tax=Rat cytomegalovirus (strain Maastricht) TaxID=79700 RepID=Q9PY84_RCMVM|nr:pR32 [rat cytomegalovirus strain Maastricht]AAD50323.1 pR32 [rat cytomegalovirus strain Maastricht]WEG71956.1 tegument protein pp150 [Murid betaherpesvirus 2]